MQCHYANWGGKTRGVRKTPEKPGFFRDYSEIPTYRYHSRPPFHIREDRSSPAPAAELCSADIASFPFGLGLRAAGAGGRCGTVPASVAGLPTGQTGRWSAAAAICTVPSRTDAVADYSAPHGCWSGHAVPRDAARRRSSSRTSPAPTWTTLGPGPDRRQRRRCCVRRDDGGALGQAFVLSGTRRTPDPQTRAASAGPASIPAWS